MLREEKIMEEKIVEDEIEDEAIEFRVIKQAGLVDANFDELNRQVRAVTEKYRNLVYSEEQIGEAKSDLADLRYKRKMVDDNRKSVKAEYMKPYEVFEGKVKETLKIFDDAISNIDSQVKHVEEVRKAEKRERIENWWKVNGCKSFDVPIEKVWEERYLNKTVSDAQWQKSLNDKVKGIEADLDIILKYPSEMMNYIVPKYKISLDLHGVIKEWEAFKQAQLETQTIRNSQTGSNGVQNKPTTSISSENNNLSIEEEKKPTTQSQACKTYWHINFEVDGEEQVIRELSNTLRQLKAKGLWFKVIAKESREEN